MTLLGTANLILYGYTLYTDYHPFAKWLGDRGYNPDKERAIAICTSDRDYKVYLAAYLILPFLFAYNSWLAMNNAANCNIKGTLQKLF